MGHMKGEGRTPPSLHTRAWEFLICGYGKRGFRPSPLAAGEVLETIARRELPPGGED